MFLDAGKLRNIAYKRGFTQRDIANQAGVSLTTVSNVFRGCRCSAIMGQRLADALDVPLDSIVDKRGMK